MKFRKQNKGTALEKISKRSLVDDDQYYSSIKYDGQMVQIAYDGDTTVKMWSSNGKPFYNQNLANEIIEENITAFHVEAEYIGESLGQMGDRGKSSKITTYRTEFAKGIESEGCVLERFMVFDILSFDGEDVTHVPFKDRYGMLMQLYQTATFHLVDHIAGISIQEAKDDLDNQLSLGWEGIMLTHANHVVKSTGRSNLRIKLKGTPTAYGTIVGTVPGTKERKGTIGSLIVRNEEGKEFSAGTGLNHQEWVLNPKLLIGHKVKYGWESIKDGNYQQPRYLGAIDPKHPDDKHLVRLNEVI